MESSITNQGRVSWLDTIKGITIILVVIHHSYLALLNIQTSPTSINDYLKFFNMIGSYVRMPAFFFTAGVVFAMVKKDKSEWFFKKRLPFMVWIIFIWTFLAFTVERLGFHLYPWNPFPRLTGLNIFTSPYGNLWFIYSLLTLSFFATITHRFNTITKITFSIIFSLSIHLFLITFQPEPSINNWLLTNLAYKGIPFFMLGVILSKPIIYYSNNLKLVTILSILMLFSYAFFDYFIYFSSSYRELFFKYIPGTFSFIGILILLGNIRPISKVLNEIGKLSLEIFLTHQYIIATYIAIIKAGNITINSDFSKLALLLLPILSCIGLMLITKSFLRPILFTPPRFWSTR